MGGRGYRSCCPPATSDRECAPWPLRGTHENHAARCLILDQRNHPARRPLIGDKATAALAAPVSAIRCGTDFPGSSLRQNDPLACSIGGGGALSSFGHIVESPFLSLVGEVSATGFPINSVGAFVTGSLDYEFQVTGRSPGDVVPVSISADLITLGRDGVHRWGFASLKVGHVFGLGVGVAACTAGLNCGGGESFQGTISVLVKSGGPNATDHMGISTFAGSSLIDEFASVSADPDIVVARILMAVLDVRSESRTGR